MPQPIPAPPPVRFREQTPKIHIDIRTGKSLYEKAYLSPKDEQTSEYDRNTTTWD